MKMLPVRCCCNPTKLLGWLPVPDKLPVGWGTTISYAVGPLFVFDGSQPARSDRTVVTLEVGKFHQNFDATGQGPITELAIKSMDHPIETFRKIRGFVENQYQ